MSRFLSEKLNKIVPYTPGEQPQGMDKLIKLNTNENPFPPSPKVQKALADFNCDNLRRYNDPTASKLLNALANNYNLKTENCFACNGSDEVLAMIFTAFCPKQACFADITYGFYSVLSGLYSVKPVIIPLKDDYSICIDDYKNVECPIFIANPNAPTGIALPIRKIETLLTQNLNRLVIVDEAYVDFGAESSVNLVTRYDNLIVVGTFSKSRSLAGARLGFAFTNKDIIADLNRVKFSFHPYNVNSLTQILGTQAINDKEYFEDCCNKVINLREYTVTELSKLGCQILPSSTNFIFLNPVKCSGEQYYNMLRKKNIIVRYFNTDRLKNFVRITIGNKCEMDSLIEVTKDILK